MKITLIPMPARIPISKGNTRHARNAASPGMRSVSIERGKEIMISADFLTVISENLLLLRHIGFTTRTSIMKMTAAMMIEANAAFGIYENNGVRNRRAIMTSTPVYRLPNGVRTPLALFTAPRDNEPVPG